MMLGWSTVSWAQAFMTNRAGFYLTRCFIGLCEGGFIPGTILMATYFYTSRELSTRLAAFWSTLNIARKSEVLACANMRPDGTDSVQVSFLHYLQPESLRCEAFMEDLGGSGCS
jgi:hypothetical protein